MDQKQALLEKYEKVYLKVCDMQNQLEVLIDQSEGYPEHEFFNRVYAALSRIRGIYSHPDRLKIHVNCISQYQVDKLEKELQSVIDKYPDILVWV